MNYSTSPQDMSGGESKSKGLPEVERRILECQLREDSRVLNNQFSQLLAKTQSFLLKNCTCKKLVVCVMSMKHVKDAFKESPLNALKSAKSTDDIIYILVERDLLSFLHCYLIENIITSCCNKSRRLKRLLKKYMKAFDEYIKRRVCETSIYYDGEFKIFTGSKSEKTVELLIITDENWNDATPFVNVKDFEIIISNAFRCNRILLNLQSIEPRCLKLRYDLIPSLVDLIFPLTLEEWNNLKSHGIAEILCRNYHYMVDKKCKYHWVRVLCIVALAVVCFYIAAVTGKDLGDFVSHDQQYTSQGT